jgi:hypothetical protein
VYPPRFGPYPFIELLRNGAQVVWLNDYNQMQLYYQPEAVAAAMGRTSAWLQGR